MTARSLPPVASSVPVRSKAMHSTGMRWAFQLRRHTRGSKPQWRNSKFCPAVTTEPPFGWMANVTTTSRASDWAVAMGRGACQCQQQQHVRPSSTYRDCLLQCSHCCTRGYIQQADISATLCQKSGAIRRKGCSATCEAGDMLLVNLPVPAQAGCGCLERCRPSCNHGAFCCYCCVSCCCCCCCTPSTGIATHHDCTCHGFLAWFLVTRMAPRLSELDSFMYTIV